MSQFRSTGGMDDSIGEDVDRGFSGVNQRLQLNQLQETEVRESLNGRMEGYWRPRKGIVERSGALTTGRIPLQLPFYIFGSKVNITTATVSLGVMTLNTSSAHGLVSGSVLNIEGIGYTSGTNPNGVFIASSASGSTITYPLAGGVGPYTTTGSSLIVTTAKTITAASVSSGVVTLTTLTPHGFAAGDFISTENIKFVSGVNPNGKFQLISVTSTTCTYSLVGGSGPYTVSGAVAYDLSKTITAVSYASDLVTITVPSHGLSGNGNAIISGISFTGNDYNTAVELTVAGPSTLTFQTSGVSNAVLGTNPRITQILIDDSANANVRASCLFSDPNTSNKEYVIVALDTVAKKIDLETYVATDIPYPPGQALSADTDMIQVFDKVMLFRDGQQALEWYPNGRAVTSASQSGSTTVTMNVRDHGLLAGASIVIAGLTGGTPANGTFTVLSVIDEDSFTYLFTTSQTQVFGVDAATMTDGFTLSPGGDYTQPQAFSANGLSITALDGLVTVSVEGNVTLKKGDVVVVYECTIPEFLPLVGQQLYITDASFTEIKFYAPVPNFTQDIISASQIGTTVTASVKGHGFSVSDSISVADLTGVYAGTMPNGTQTVTSITGDSFTYTAAAALPYYTIATPLNVTDVEFVSAGVLRVTITAHGLGTSGWANISGFSGVDSNLNGNYLFTRHNTDKLDFNFPGATAAPTDKTAVLSQMKYDFITTNAKATKPSRSSQQIEAGGQFSVGGGFMHQPGAPWGVYFQRRLWVPHYYNSSGPYNAPEYTSTKIKDEIAVSDILDTTTFDQIENQFRISGGTADYVVGMHGFYEDGLIVLNRNSLHLISGTQGSLLDTKVTELTSEVGCLARKTIVSRGNMVMFLSDNGVYAVEFLNDYNLRGADEPISKNIQPYIDRINKDYANNSVGVLFDNRYYLAVPLDSVAGAGDARGNNAILVFNFLNKGWESLDTFGDSRFLIKDFVIGSAGVRNNIYAVTSNGGLHQLEAADSSVDRLNVSNVGGELVTPTINSTLITRGYDLGTMERKRFTDAQIVMQNLPGGTGEYMISFAAEDPDNSSEIGTTTQFLGGQILTPSTTNEAETAGIRCRLGGIRGYTGTMILTRTQGSPKINSVKVAGSVTNRQIISQK